MSARNYLSAREKCNKYSDCLPNINQQKLGYRLAQDLPPLSANTSKLVNRNLNYQYEINSYLGDCVGRAGTPFSDFFSDSGTSTPDFHSEESDSSSGSILRRSTAEATKQLAEEWQRIERTLYDEDGEKCMRPHIVEECKQWKQLHPQFRVCGRAIKLPDKRLARQGEYHDEVIAMHYSDYEEFSELEERLSQSSTDVTPQNSPRPSMEELFQHENKLSREKVTFNGEDETLSDTFCSLLQITPIQIHSPSHKRKQSSSLLRSEIASSKWMRNRPDSSLNCDRNSAKSFVSLDTRNYNALSASDRTSLLNSRVVTAKNREFTRLEPLWTPPLEHNDVLKINGLQQQYNIRKVSLPPLLLEEEKRKVASGKKHTFKGRRTKAFQQLDRIRH